MIESRKYNFQRYLFILGIIAVFVVGYLANRILLNTDLAKAEAELTSYFKVFQKYKEKVYIPSIEVLGPDGGVVDLLDNDGNFTVLNIWATWCAPCVKELPSLRRLNKQLPYGSGWRVVAVSIDSKEHMEKVARFTSTYKVTDIAGFHDYKRNLQKNIKVDKLPMTLLINDHGRILYKIEGEAFWHDKAIVDFLKLVHKIY